MTDPKLIAENIGRAFALLCDYHAEVAGMLREIRRQLGEGDPALAPISNIGVAGNALYLYPMGVAQLERPRHWAPRDIGEFYGEDAVLSGARDSGIVLPYVYFQTGVEDSVEPPWVTLGLLFDIEGAPAGKDIYKVCNQVHSRSLELKAAWSEPGRWYGPESFARGERRLRFEMLWFPFADLLDGTPEDAIAQHVVTPLRERFDHRRVQSAG